ncbi:4-hydroxybenzoate octaprenyltransferase [Sphingomonas sp. BK235]|uniref:4-hydroxybenzoate octaprenyltransferase n=1 Tax=Sphingomonas sp. BK235 TaxID=2512131 RepID=UPI001052C20F|nr:4-hydroxybenzoate octaprenyltransferase [Sphingomonas sp. BK235]TCP35591.1 4-hydroxybenzoate polyprenyltransferase [Sphingomonas sp. BK235]
MAPARAHGNHGFRRGGKPRYSARVTDIVPDSQHRGLVAALPPLPRALALLARLDRPIGWWLLFWPGAWSVALAGGAVTRWPLLLWLLLGSVAMRGAGCVYNDIVDRELDASVARTRHRPLASGQVSLLAAWAWLVFLCLIGLVVLLQLHLYAAIVSLAALAPVAAYPFMKRITWWPQAWLGLVFSWAALVGWSETWGWLTAPGLLLYAGSVFWVIGYDTIYALQDREDDALIGIGSSALAMGRHVRGGIAACYAIALAFWAAAFWHVRADPLALAALLPVALHLGWQAATLHPDDGLGALRRFRSNRFAGLLMLLGCAVVGTPL